MADPTDPNDPTNQLGNVAGAVPGVIGNLAGNQAQMNAYANVLKNLQGEMGDYSKIGPAGYQNLTAQQLGPSALASIQPDAAARGDQQAAISQLGDIANSGGLELSDRNALNQLEQTESRNNAARGNSLANQFAARGQLGGGAQLAMDLAGNQNAATNANQQGESIAAQAQQRAMQAVLNKGAAARSMANDDYARKQAAAQAADSIAAHNASMRTDASKYNNTLAGQNLEDQYKKLQGETGVTTATNNALLGQAGQSAANSVGAGNALGSIVKNLPKGGGSGGGQDPGLDSGGTNDLNGNRGGPSDLSGGAAGTGDATDAAAGTGFGSDPSEWDQFASVV